MIDENKKDNLIDILILFYICSLIGYIYEMILCYIYNGKFISHGILYGPWLPIYGSGAILISLLNKYRRHPILIFILSFFITGILEYICGFILLNFFDMRLWDYRGWFLNINGFVCFLSALCFGIGGLLIIYGIIPLVKVIKKYVQEKKLKILLIAITSLFLLDIGITMSKHLLK